jgi:hypothetical protein
MPRKPKAVKPGRVRKIIKPLYPQEAEKAEIAIDGADHLYSEVRIENDLTNAKGKHVKLKQGAPVEVTIQAEEKNTVPKHS